MTEKTIYEAAGSHQLKQLSKLINQMLQKHGPGARVTVQTNQAGEPVFVVEQPRRKEDG